MNIGKVSMRMVIKYLAVGFLSLCLILLLLLLSVGSNAGLRAAAHFANQVEGVSISGIKGSLYSQVFINRIQIALDQSVSVDVRDLDVDITLRCALDLAACLSHLRVNKLDIVLPEAASETSQTSVKQYITLPIPIDIKKISITQFTLSQALVSESSASRMLLRINKLAIQDMYALERFRINNISVDDILLFANQSAPAANAPQAKTLASEFSLQQLKTLLQNAPKLQLPDVFIPIDAMVKQAAVKRICWQVLTQPEAKNCVALNSASMSVQQQNIDVKMNVEAQTMLAAQGVIAQSVQFQSQMNLQKNWQHKLSIGLIQNFNSSNQAELAVTLAGDASNTKITSMIEQSNSRKSLLNANIKGKWIAPNFPIAITGQVEDLSPLNRFINSTVDAQINKANFSLDGDWNEYTFLANVQLINKVSVQTGLSTIELLANVSPANQTIVINKFETGGELGKVSLVGSTKLEPLSSNVNTLAIHSDLKLNVNSLNLGIIKTDLTSTLNGQFVLSHVFTEQWMRGALKCKDLNGSFKGFPLSVKCDVSLSQKGELSIKQLVLNQANSKLNISGKLLLPHTNYLKFTAEELTQSYAQLVVSANIPDASQFDTKLAGALALEGSLNGSIAEPTITLVSDVTALIYDNIGLEQANVYLSVDAKNDYAVTLDINLAELAVDNIIVNTSTIRANGNQHAHTISLDLQTKDFSTQNSVAGSLTLNEQVTRWRGKWTKGIISLPFATLKIDNAASIVANMSAQVFSLGDHCWLANDDKDRLCFRELSFADDIGTALLDIAYDIASIPRYYFPELVLPDTALPLKGQVTANYSRAEGLNLKAYNNIIGGFLETSRHTLELTAIIANITLENDVLSTVVHAGSPRTGIIGLQSQLDLHPDKRIHKGRIGIDNFDLNLLQRFIPSTQSILGMVNADIEFAGPLFEPMLSGELIVSSGELILDAYTYPLTDFRHTVNFAGQMATMEGGFQLGKGQGTYHADVSFTKPFSINGRLNGKDMQFALNNSKAQVSPDLTFLISPSDLILKGTIGIPSAEIKIEELPVNAKTPSPDTIIIGQKPPEPIIPLAMDIDLNIQIDKAKRGFVTADALDLEATLAGDLTLNVEQKRSKNNDTFQAMRTTLNGQVNVIDGSYEAYGQMLLVRSGKIFFNGEPSLPQFDIRAIRNPLNTEGDVIAGLHITGNPVVPRVELFSEPAMTQAKQLSYLLQGRDLSTSSANAGSSTNMVLVNALVNFGVGRGDNSLGQLGDALGFDSLNVQTAGAGDNSQVQITGRIAEDIQITYGVGLFDQASEVILKYQIMPQLFIEAKSGAEAAVDLFYQISRGQVD